MPWATELHPFWGGLGDAELRYMDPSQIGKRAWTYAGVLQDAGLSCFEYVEQLTLLLFLKMADQLTEEPYNQTGHHPTGPELEGVAAPRWRGARGEV